MSDGECSRYSWFTQILVSLLSTERVGLFAEDGSGATGSAEEKVIARSHRAMTGNLTDSRTRHAQTDGTRPDAFTTSLANCAGEPGVENMLGHAPQPLAANGLDMHRGHPARSRRCVARLTKSRFSRPGARNPALDELNRANSNRKMVQRPAEPEDSGPKRLESSVCGPQLSTGIRDQLAP
jgi:hypothetical protein